MGIPLRTVKYHMNKHHIFRRTYSDLSDGELCEWISRILREDPGSGCFLPFLFHNVYLILLILLWKGIRKW